MLVIKKSRLLQISGILHKGFIAVLNGQDLETVRSTDNQHIVVMATRF